MVRFLLFLPVNVFARGGGGPRRFPRRSARGRSASRRPLAPVPVCSSHLLPARALRRALPYAFVLLSAKSPMALVWVVCSPAASGYFTKRTSGKRAVERRVSPRKVLTEREQSSPSEAACGSRGPGAVAPTASTGADHGSSPETKRRPSIHVDRIDGSHERWSPEPQNPSPGKDVTRF